MICISFIIHQVNALLIPFHREIIFCMNQAFPACTVGKTYLISHLNLSHNAVKFLQDYLRLPYQLCL